MSKLRIFGTGPLAKNVRQMINQIGENNVISYVVDDDYFSESVFDGLKVEKLSNIDNTIPLIICVGYKNMRKRIFVFEKLKNIGFQFINIIHPSVVIGENIEMGVNNIIFPNTCIENNVTIGNNNIIWSQTLIGHDAKIGNHNYLSARVLLGGNCILQDGCFLGNQVATINDLNIANETYLLAGCFLFQNTKPSNKYLGYPAKQIGEHLEEGINI